jgi:hypothetical protein
MFCYSSFSLVNFSWSVFLGPVVLYPNFVCVWVGGELVKGWVTTLIQSFVVAVLLVFLATRRATIRFYNVSHVLNILMLCSDWVPVTCFGA